MIRNRALRAAAVAAALASAAGCTDWAGYDLDYAWNQIPALSTMRRSVAYDPYDMPRLPAPNSVPSAGPNADAPPPFTQLQLDSAGATLTNPFAGGGDAAVLARGQAAYETYCTACHGPQGAGNGPVVGPGKYPFAPAINIPATAARSDGYIYGVIAVGRGLMPPYGAQVEHADRWAIVSYVRELQRQGGAAPAAAAAPVPGVPTVVNPPDVMPGAGPVADTAGQAQQQ